MHENIAIGRVLTQEDWTRPTDLRLLISSIWEDSEIQSRSTWNTS